MLSRWRSSKLFNRDMSVFHQLLRTSCQLAIVFLLYQLKIVDIGDWATWIIVIIYRASLSRCYTLKRLGETCVQQRWETSFSRRCTEQNEMSKLVPLRKTSFLLHGETLVFICNRCRSRIRFYFKWNLSRNGSLKKFQEADRVTQCNACRRVTAVIFLLSKSTLFHKSLFF